jgi:demethylmenaquinone methyltransferase/2-methoxy-6-polyprenyl-1,4-benzoquinol methylase
MLADQYLGHMRSYYDNPSHTAYAQHGSVFADEYDARYHTPGDGLRELMLVLREMTAGKRVLEIACGHGRWTRYVAQVASHVLATDNSPRMLKQAAELVHHNNPLPPGRVEFRECNAMDVANLPETFDAGFHVNFFDHLPRTLHQPFLDGFHSRLEPGAPVLLGVNKLTDKTRQNLYAKPGYDDKYLLRHRPDGSTYEIIDNEMNEQELTAAIGLRGKDFHFTAGKNLTWLAYTAS